MQVDPDSVPVAQEKDALAGTVVEVSHVLPDNVPAGHEKLVSAGMVVPIVHVLPLIEHPGGHEKLLFAADVEVELQKFPDNIPPVQEYATTAAVCVLEIETLNSWPQVCKSVNTVFEQVFVEYSAGVVTT